jgi:hypothetical protein
VTRIVEFYSLSLVLVLQAVAPRVAAKGAGTPQILDDFLRFVEPRVTADEWDSVLRACVDTLFKLDEGKAGARTGAGLLVPPPPPPSLSPPHTTLATTATTATHTHTHTHTHARARARKLKSSPLGRTLPLSFFPFFFLAFAS